MRSLLVLALAGCTTYLPPPAPPSLRLPPVALPDERPPAGFGRLVIDTTRAPARVDEIVGEGDFCYRRHCRSVTITHNLGTTPCVVDLPYGVHDLELTSLTDEHEHDRVRYRFPSGETHGYLRTLGHHEPVSAQASAGVALLGLGAALALGALAAGISGAQTSGLGLGVSGAGLLLVGIPVAATARSVERPGSATWWRIEP